MCACGWVCENAEVAYDKVNLNSERNVIDSTKCEPSSKHTFYTHSHAHIHDYEHCKYTTRVVTLLSTIQWWLEFRDLCVRVRFTDCIQNALSNNFDEVRHN